MQELLFWSDIRWLYATVVWGSFIILVVLAVVPATLRSDPCGSGFLYRSRVLHPGVFLGVLWGFLFSARWPGLFYFTSFNVDEAQILAAAQVLTLDPVFFRSAECGSSGPLVVYPLLVPWIFGIDPSYFSSRVVGLFMLGTCASAFYGVGRLVFDDAITRMAVLVPVTFFALTTHWDFVHYTSEHAPLFFLWIGLYCTARVAFLDSISARNRLISALIGSVCFSITPLAKLQATYLAMFGGILLLGACGLRARGTHWKRQISAVALVAAAALIAPLGFFLFTFVHGVHGYFLTSYFGNALAYQSAGLPGMTSHELLTILIGRTLSSGIFAAGFAVFVLLAGAALMAPSSGRSRHGSLVFMAISALYLMLATSAVTATLRDYEHYLIFLPFFAASFVLALSGNLIDRSRTIHTSNQCASNYQLTCLAILGITMVFPTAAHRWETGNLWVGSARFWSEKAAQPITAVGNALRSLAEHSNRRLAVWGYRPEFYIQSGMKQATRLSTSSAIFNENSLREFFLQTYVDDLHSTAPDWFVDSVAPDSFLMNDPQTHSHEQVSEVADFIKSNYEEVRDIRGVRIYQRKTNSE